tara:strand:- start:571 stop:948 length:378 start_codon:yes stop_codon:yes gene_type:complete
MQKPVQKGSRREDYYRGLIVHPLVCPQPCNFSVIDQQLLYEGLLQSKAFLLFQGFFHTLSIFPFIRLGSEGPYGRPFAHVQSAKLDTGPIDATRHLSSQSIDLSDYVPFGRPSYGRITGHLGDSV